jgi:molybdate transport system permease protein
MSLSALAYVAAFSALMAGVSVLIVLPPGVLLGWALARGRFRGKAVVETLVSLPLVVPPVATGLILLRLFGQRSPVGRALDAVGVEVVFTWKAVVLAMVVMSLPLVVLTVRAGIEQVNVRYEQLAATLGAGRWRVFVTITLPLARRSVLAAALLGFARALGEFGATIMVAGGIPGQTETLSTAIYTLTESGRESDAMAPLLVSLALAFAAMAASNAVLRREQRR